MNSHCTCIVLLTENANFWNDWRHPLLSNQLQQLCIWYDLILFVCSNRLLTSHSAPNTAAQLAHFETTTGQWVLTLELLCRRGVGDIRHTLDDNKETFPPSISLLRRCLDFFQFGMKFGMRAMTCSLIWESLYLIPNTPIIPFCVLIWVLHNDKCK